MKLPKNLGMLLLSVWLIVTGLTAFISIGSLGLLLPLLAIAAGVLLLLGR